MHPPQAAAGSLHDAPAGLRRSRDADHVDVVDQRRARLAGADEHLQDVGRQHALHGLDRPPHRERRQLRGLDHHGIAGEQRGHGVAEREVERRVPRADDADHAARPVGDQGALAHERARAHLLHREPARSTAHQAAEIEAHAHQLPDDVEAGLARLALEELENLAARPDELAARASQQPAALVHRHRRPRRLRRAGTRDDGLDRRGVVDRQLVDDLAARRVVHRERCRMRDRLAAESMSHALVLLAQNCMR